MVRLVAHYVTSFLIVKINTLSFSNRLIKSSNTRCLSMSHEWRHWQNPRRRFCCLQKANDIRGK
jgi:hypothetical protein